MISSTTSVCPCAMSWAIASCMTQTIAYGIVDGPARKRSKSSLHRRSNIAGLVPIPCPGVESIRLDGTLQGHHTYGLELYGLLSMVELGQAPEPNPHPNPLQPE